MENGDRYLFFRFLLSILFFISNKSPVIWEFCSKDASTILSSICCKCFLLSNVVEPKITTNNAIATIEILAIITNFLFTFSFFSKLYNISTII